MIRPEHIYEENRKRITALIKQSGLSMEGFAKQYEIPYRTLQNWLTTKGVNVRTPSPFVLKLLERVVNIDYPKS